MLKNAYLDAKIGGDTAENEPSEKGLRSWYMYRQLRLQLAASRRAMHAGEEEPESDADRKLARETQCCSSKAEAVLTVNSSAPRLGDMVSGPALADPGELIEGHFTISCNSLL